MSGFLSIATYWDVHPSTQVEFQTPGASGAFSLAQQPHLVAKKLFDALKGPVLKAATDLPSGSDSYRLRTGNHGPFGIVHGDLPIQNGDYLSKMVIYLSKSCYLL